MFNNKQNNENMLPVFIYKQQIVYIQHMHLLIKTLLLLLIIIIILIMLTIIKCVINNNNNVLIHIENTNDNEKHVMCISSTCKFSDCLFICNYLNKTLKAITVKVLQK